MSWLKRPILAACSVSVAGHVLFVLCTPEQSGPRRREAPVQLEFTLAPAVSSQAPSSDEVEASPAPVQQPRPKRERATEPRPGAAQQPEATVTAPAATGAEAPTIGSTETPAAEPPPARTPSPGRIDLSPRAAAATLTAEIEQQLVGGSCSAARGVGADCQTGAALAVAKPSVRGAGARLPGSQEYLLEPARGGGYVHQSPGFNARIEPNGDVHFDDKLRDLNDVVSSLVGEQAYTAQKRRFLAQTSELRDQLAAEAREKAQARGLGELAHQLQRILADASRSGLQKRIALFALWDDCANDALGSEAQRKIEGFVRAYLPADGPLAYSVAELAELNRRRVSKRVFAPYDNSGPRPG